jgi:hypothetical protein
MKTSYRQLIILLNWYSESCLKCIIGVDLHLQLEWL